MQVATAGEPSQDSRSHTQQHVRGVRTQRVLRLNAVRQGLPGALMAAFARSGVPRSRLRAEARTYSQTPRHLLVVPDIATTTPFDGYMPTEIIGCASAIRSVPIRRKTRRYSARLGEQVFEKLPKRRSLRVATPILGYEDRGGQRPFVSCVVACELLEGVAPGCGRGVLCGSPPSRPCRLCHDHPHNRGRTRRACPAVRPRCPKGGQHTCRVERIRQKSIVSYGHQNYGIPVSPYR